MNKQFSHLKPNGDITMVDITNKNTSFRVAKATANILMPADVATTLKSTGSTKGDWLITAKIAGIQAAKKTADLIPLCHQLQLAYVDIAIDWSADNKITIISTCKCTQATGVEMEAMTAVTVAALTIYDMCKALSQQITIDNVRLLSKTGGKTDYSYGDN